MLILLVGAGWWSYRQLAGSLPQLDGDIIVSGIGSPVTIHRDALGIPTIRAESRVDLAFATGFVHAQDRFFQMDLLRRNSAGELSEIVGAAALEHDQAVRVNRFRDVARRRLEMETDGWLEQLQAYADGVNAGLQSSRKPPFEYLLLGVQPDAWKPEDSLLVIFSMFLDLQDDGFDFEVGRGLIHDLLPQEMFEFLMSRGSQWDAPIHGEAFEVPPVPGPELFDARKFSKLSTQRTRSDHLSAYEEPYVLGSNNWAVAGQHTSDGRALLADDMHLGLQVPHIWYRASFVWPDEAGRDAEQWITGLSLPGTPAMIVGSNGHIAWGFTNTEGDWVDAVIIDVDPNDPSSYMTQDGSRKFDVQTETIKVKGEADRFIEVTSTIWGPVIKLDHMGRPLALRWVAHDPEGVNNGLMRMESVRTLNEAVRLANESGAPHQNFVVADSNGRIAWTVLGRIPRRVGHDGWLPRSWADGSVRWEGYLQPDDYPRIIDPEVGRIWTANARVVSDDFYRIIGDSGYDLGARQQQIRDGLLAMEDATEADMLELQLDDRAIFLSGWQQLLLSVLDGKHTQAEDAQRALLRQHVTNWGARAAVDSVGYRAVWRFRGLMIQQLCDLISQPLNEADSDFSLRSFRRIEGPLWKIISERPGHFLDPRFENWDAWLAATADQVIAEATKDGASLSDYTWGRLNTSRIKHPMSLGVPALSRWLDMPAQQLPGGFADMPRIQSPTAGASQRMAVSPGREQDGYMHMPCGQSGHPLSPHYADSHPEWAEGNPSPFLPGPVQHTLTLVPVAN